MEPVITSHDIETRRMELRGVVKVAGEVIAQYWPMRTFVHHNPLHSLEYLPFEETVRRGHQFLGGNGYLPSHQYRAYLKSGRIKLEDLDAALKPLVRDTHVLIGSHRLAHGEVLRACLTEGLCEPVVEPLETELPDPSKELIDQLAAKLTSVLRTRDLRERIDNIVQSDQADLGRWITLSHWCDDTLGTEIVRQINDQLIKWCGAFLDEGTCGLAHAGEGKGSVRRLEGDRVSRMVALRDQGQPTKDCSTPGLIRKMRSSTVSTRSAFRRIFDRIISPCN